MTPTAALLLLALTGNAAAQEAPAKSNLDWAVALGGRFRQLHDPVVSTYAVSQLAALVCGYDRQAGTQLFQESLYGLRTLTPRSFTSARHRLPSPSFTSLWNSVTPAALKCNPELSDSIDTGRAKAKVQEERQQANDDIRNAFSAVENDPDRAAQLVETALSVSDPQLLDMPTLTLLLSHLRERAPDVSDDLFPEVLDFVAPPLEPDTELLLELGEYLFTSPRYRDAPDMLQESEVHQVGTTTIANFTANRKSTSSDDIHDYIDRAVRVLTSTNDRYYDPVAAYAIAFQLLPKADDFAPDLSEKLREVLPQIEQQIGAKANQVQAAIATNETPEVEGGEGARKRDRLVGQVLAAAGAKRFAEAREMVQGIDDSGVGGQVRSLIDFAASAAALEKEDPQWSFTLSNPLRGGVKRALLYAGMAGAARNREEALGYFGLGIKDVDLLPAEQRMVTATALMSVILPKETENGILALTLFVQAANDAYTSPHKGRFEPQIVRKIYSGTATAFTDSALILANRRCVCEVVDTGRGRHTSRLKVPGLDAYDMPGAARAFSGADPDRLESILVGIRDETLLSNVLVAFAAQRLKH